MFEVHETKAVQFSKIQRIFEVDMTSFKRKFFVGNENHSISHFDKFGLYYSLLSQIVLNEMQGLIAGCMIVLIVQVTIIVSTSDNYKIKFKLSVIGLKLH